MCEYCEIQDYTGENIPHNIQVDGTKQYYEIFILDDLEYGQNSLNILGTYSDIGIKINYCPMCGKKLEW